MHSEHGISGLMSCYLCWAFSVFVQSYLWSLDRSDQFVLVIYTDEFIIVGNFEQLITWCEKNLACEVDIKNVGVW